MESNQKHHEDNKHKINIVVSTTSGFFPTTGFDSVPIHQKIEVQLDKAAKALKLVDVTGWIATVEGKRIDPQQSYEYNNLGGEVEIDWGPEHGGGGNA